MLRLLALAAIGALLGACGIPDPVVPHEDTTGRVGVNTHTTGSDPPFTYRVILESAVAGTTVEVTLGANGQTRFDDVPNGSYALELEGIPENCTLQGSNPINVTVVGNTDFYTFDVTCVPHVGALQIFVEFELNPTNPQDPGNFQIVLDGSAQTAPACAPATVSCGRSTYVTSVRAGPHGVALAGIPATCRVISENPQSVVVLFSVQLTVFFRVDCSGQYGTLRIVTRTTGLDQDPNEYLVNTLGQVIGMGSNSTYDFDRAPPGNQPVFLQDVASHCRVAGLNPRTEVIVVGQTTTATFDVSCAPTSRPILFESNRGGNVDIFVMESDGTRVTSLTAGPTVGEDKDPAWSPDGRQIVFRSTRGGRSDLWIMESGGENPRRITDSDAPEEHPAFSPDGNLIVFDLSGPGGGTAQIYSVPAAGGVLPTQLTNAANDSERPRYSPDGDEIVFASNRDGDWDIYTMPAVVGGIATNLTSGSTFDEVEPAWSPDGATIVFSRNAGGDGELWTMSSTGGLASGGTQLTDNNFDDTLPFYSPNGLRVVFTRRDGDEELFVITVSNRVEQPLTTDSTDDAEPEWRW